MNRQQPSVLFSKIDCSFEQIFDYTADVEFLIFNAANTFLKSLDLTMSKSGTAFYQTTLERCFNLPPLPEVWIKFDVYFDGISIWRAMQALLTAFAALLLLFLLEDWTLETVSESVKGGIMVDDGLYMDGDTLNVSVSAGSDTHYTIEGAESVVSLQPVYVENPYTLLGVVGKLK